MKFSAEVGTLKAALARLAKVVKPNKAIPILGYVRVVGTDGQLHLHGTDHRVYYIIPVEGTILDAEGEILLSVTETHSMLSKLPAGAEVEVSTDDSARIIIRSGNTTWYRESRTSVDMPEFPILAEDLFQEISVTDFTELLTAALRAAPKRQNFSPGTTQLWFHDGVVDSGDGTWYQRIACAQLASVETTVPMESAKILVAVMRGWDGMAQFGHNGHHVVVRCAGEVLGISRHTHAFPDISPYLEDPKVSHTERLSVLSKEFSTAIQHVSLSAPSDTGLIRLDLNPGKIKLSAKTTTGGEAETFCTAVWEGKPRTVFVDWRNLTGVIAACGAPERLGIAFGPDSRRSPSTLYITEGDVTAALVQQRGR